MFPAGYPDSANAPHNNAMHTKRRWCAVSEWLDHCRRSVIVDVIQRDGSECNWKPRWEPVCHLSIDHAEHPVATNPPTTAAFLELETAVELLLPPGTASCRSMRWASLAR